VMTGCSVCGWRRIGDEDRRRRRAMRRTRFPASGQRPCRTCAVDAQSEHLFRDEWQVHELDELVSEARQTDRLTEGLTMLDLEERGQPW